MEPLPLHLAIDVGNSSIKAAPFRGGELLEAPRRFRSDDWRELGDWATNLRARNIIYSTVANVPPPAWLENMEANGMRVYDLAYRGKLPFRSDYVTPETLGQDRVGVAAGSMCLPHRGPWLVVDAGSCITYDLVDADAVHRGGNISPGIDMRLRAMHHFTARLPLVATDELSGEMLGVSTESALLHGALTGAACELEGLFFRLQPAYSGLKVVLTGGDAERLSGLLNIPCRLEPHLLLRGLDLILSTYLNEA